MNKPALLIIDVQKGLDSPSLGKRNNPDAEAKMASLLAVWREKSLPVVHIKHNSLEPGSTLRAELPGNEIKEAVKPLPTEKLFEKNVNSAFIGTNLEGFLHGEGIQDLVVVGLTTDHCVSTSVRMAANLGFNVWLIGDATATFERESYDRNHFSAEQMHEVNLASLDQEFCAVITTEAALSEISKQ